MKGKSYFLSSALFLILTSLLLVPALGQTKEDSWSGRHKMRRATLVKELKLSPDKAKDLPWEISMRRIARNSLRG